MPTATSTTASSKSKPIMHAAKSSTSSVRGKRGNSRNTSSAQNWQNVIRFVETVMPSEAMLAAVDLDSVLLYHEPQDGDFHLGRVLPLGRKLVRLLKSRGYKVVVLTARPWTQTYRKMKGVNIFTRANQSNYDKIKSYLRRRGVLVDSVTNVKPYADAYFDDKAFRIPKNWI